MRSTALTDLRLYMHQVVHYRHFWAHLAFSDLRARFRRSYLGILWLALQPLLLTVIMSVVFIFVFKQSFADYSVYLFSGMVTWDFIVGCFMIGSGSFLAAEGYIRQVRLPMIIYPLKAVFYCCIVFTLAFSGFALYAMFVKPEIFSWRWIYLLPFLVTLFVLGAPFTIISAIVNIKFRDYQQSVTLFLQMLQYMSPVMLVRSVFEHQGLKQWTAINPVASLMDILRQPLLYKTDPELLSYAVVLLWAAVFWALAIYMLVRNERKIVFYY